MPVEERRRIRRMEFVGEDDNHVNRNKVATQRKDLCRLLCKKIDQMFAAYQAESDQPAAFREYLREARRQIRLAYYAAGEYKKGE